MSLRPVRLQGQHRIDLRQSSASASLKGLAIPIVEGRSGNCES